LVGEWDSWAAAFFALAFFAFTLVGAGFAGLAFSAFFCFLELFLALFDFITTFPDML